MKYWKVLGISAAVFALAGCGGGSQNCTMIAAPDGIGLEISEELAATATNAELDVCWAGECSTQTMELMPSTKAEPQDCTGTAPDDSCSANMVETGKKDGFAFVEELPVAEVDVSVTLLDEAGTHILQDSISITPETIYPNGPQCGGAGVQAQLMIEDSGLQLANTGT